MDIKLIERSIKENLGFELYNEQRSAIKNLCKGNFVEVKTGEGKSLINVVTACSLCETHENVYIVSINNYLAKRDYLQFKNVIGDLGLTCEFNETLDNIVNKDFKKTMHSSNIIFTSTNELVFDYLRWCIGESDININLDCCIVDECDYVLLDNAQSEFSISNSCCNKEVPIWVYTVARKFCELSEIGIEVNKINGKVKEEFGFDFIVSKLERTAYLTDKGRKFAERFFGLDNLELINGLERALLDTVIAEFCFSLDVDYSICDNKIKLIDLNNGRILNNSRKENGLQLALEIKENVSISDWSDNCISISYQNFYNKFKFLCGLSGTLFNTENEINTVYNKKVVRVKPHFQSKVDYRGFITSQDLQGKYYFTCKDIEGVNPRPVLVICGSDKEAKEVHSYLNSKLKNKFIYYLDSNNVDTVEEEVVKKAGNLNTITVSTFLSSRGVDIKVNSDVDELGGLHVISLGCFTNSRIDRQVRGRSGRQGGSGSYSFIVSLEDEVFRFLNQTDMEKLKSLKTESFYCKTWQMKLKRYCKSCQKSMCENLSYSRVNNYFIDKVLYAQQQELLNMFTSDSKELIEMCCSFIDYESSNIRKGVVSFLGFLVDSNNVDDVVESAIIPKLKSNINSLDLSKIRSYSYLSLFNGFNEYKDKCFKQFLLLGDNISSASRFFEYNENLLYLYRRIVFYSFINKLLWG